MAPGLRRMGYVLRYPDLPLSEHCKSILLPGGHRGLGCTPGVPGATHRDTWLTFGSPFRRPRPRAPGCTPLGGALGSSQGVFPVLFVRSSRVSRLSALLLEVHGRLGDLLFFLPLEHRLRAGALPVVLSRIPLRVRVHPREKLADRLTGGIPPPTFVTRSAIFS